MRVLVSHSSRKNKDAARVGHPALWLVWRGPDEGFGFPL
jgi:hypothetical protein